MRGTRTGTRTRLRRVTAAAMVSLAVLAAGCSGDDSGVDTAQDSVDGGDAGEGFGGIEQDEPAGDDAAGGDTATEAGGATEDGEASVDGGRATAGQHLIREVTVRLASDDPETTVEAIHRAAVDADGFVADEDLHREDGVLYGTVVVRVPSTELPGALGRVEAAGTEVIGRQRTSTDVTLEVTDVAAQLRNLRALETELLELLADARETGDTEQVLHVFDRVRGVRDEIERLDGRRATLADRVSLATITVHVEPTPELLAATAPERDPEPEPWDPGRRLSLAWQNTVQGLQTLADALIVFVVTVLPLLALWVLPIGALVLAARRWRRRGGVAPTSRTAPPPPAQPTSAGSVPSATDVDQD